MIRPLFNSSFLLEGFGGLFLCAKKRSPKQNAGTALVMAVVLLGILSLGSAGVWRYLHLTFDNERRYETLEMTRHLAEAGLEKAIAELRVRPGAYRGEQNTPLGDGRFTVVVRPGAGPRAFVLVSTGERTAGDPPRALAATTLDAQLVLDGAGAILSYHWRERKK